MLLPNGANVVREQNDINKVAFRLVMGKNVPTTDNWHKCLLNMIMNFGMRV